MKDFRYYAECFTSLHTARKLGKPAPHKALLLLSVIDLVENKVIKSNRVELTDTLVRTFNDNARKFYANSTLFKPDLLKPFYHMQHEPFWHLVAVNDCPSMPMAAESGIGYGKNKCTYSLKWMREHYRYAEIDCELFELLKNEDVRARLRVILISTYLNERIDLFMPMVSLPLYFSRLSTCAC